MPKATSHKPSSFRRWGWLALLVWLGCQGLSYGQALVLHLRNGDRLTGRLVSETTNAVVITTAFSEQISISTALIERREEIATSPSVGATNAPAQPKLPPPAPASGVVSELVLTNKPSMAQAAGGAAKSPDAAAKPPPPSSFRKFLSEWRGEAQFGANLGFSTKDREAFTGHVKLTHNHTFPNERPMRNILDYDVAYGITEDVLSDNRMDGTWKTEYDLTKQFLIYNNIAAGYDEIRGINFQYDLGPGVGYKWVSLTNFVFKTELGGDYQKQYFIHKETSSRYSLRLAEEMWWQITPKIRWDEKVEFFPSFQAFREYRLRLETNLSYLLKENLTLTLNVVDLYDTAVPADVSQNDLQIRTLIGIKF